MDLYIAGGFLGGLVFAALVAVIRIELCHRIDQRRFGEISALKVKALRDYRPDVVKYSYPREHELASSQLLDLRKWTYRQFYPNDPKGN